MTDKIGVLESLAESFETMDANGHKWISTVAAAAKVRTLLREDAQPNIGQRKAEQLKQRGMVPIGTILQDPSAGRRATVDDFGRVQWWAVDGSGMMAACCNNPAQCWEPCGDLGKSAEHAQPDETPEDIFLKTLLEWRSEDWHWHFEQFPELANRVRAQLPADEELARFRADAQRLDFVLGEDAFIYSQTTDAGVTVFQLWNQDEDENFRILSGEGVFFKTPREAIDAAVAARKESE